MSRLSESMARTESALQELRRTNQKLGIHGRDRSDDGRVEPPAVHRAGRARDGAGRARRHAVLLLALDLDNFKNINDAYGHQIGDEVLRGVVRQCLDAIRPAGTARVGGEEFMALLPDMPLEGARMTAERVRSSIASSPFEPISSACR